MHLRSELNPFLSLLICRSHLYPINQSGALTHLPGLARTETPLRHSRSPHPYFLINLTVAPLLPRIELYLTHCGIDQILTEAGLRRQERYLKKLQTPLRCMIPTGPFCIQEEWVEVEDNQKSVLKLPDSAKKTSPAPLALPV